MARWVTKTQSSLMPNFIVWSTFYGKYLQKMSDIWVYMEIFNLQKYMKAKWGLQFAFLFTPTVQMTRGILDSISDT